MIDVIGLHKSFDGQAVLKGVDFRVEKGEVFAVIGGSGQGKSVLLKHLLGLLKPDSGQVLIEGEDITRLKGPALYKLRDRFGYLFQGGALFDSMTIFDNVAFPLREKTSLKPAEVKARAEEELNKVGLKGMGHKYPADVSGGMKKRAAFARVLVMKPEIVLFDEPTTGLDPVLVNAIHRLILDLHRKQGFTAVMVSHEIPDIFFISNRILALYNRTIVFQGTPEELEAFEHPFKDEVLKSIEGLQEELTGLYSRRYFKVRYQTELKREAFREAYAVVVFTIENLDAVSAGLGHEAVPEAIREGIARLPAPGEELGGTPEGGAPLVGG